MRDAAAKAGHPNGPGGLMSVTKLKTVGSWQTAWQGADADLRTNVRGRVITGMLTGGDPTPDGRTVVVDPRRGRTH
jgi:hypothetical protein